MSGTPGPSNPHQLSSRRGGGAAASARNPSRAVAVDPYQRDDTPYDDPRYYPPAPVAVPNMTEPRIAGAPDIGSHLGEFSQISQGQQWRAAAERNSDGFRVYPAPRANDWHVPPSPRHRWHNIPLRNWFRPRPELIQQYIPHANEADYQRGTGGDAGYILSPNGRDYFDDAERGELLYYDILFRPEIFQNCPIFQHGTHNDARLAKFFVNPDNPNVLVGGVYLPHDVQDTWYFRNRAILAKGDMAGSRDQQPNRLRSHFTTVFSRHEHFTMPCNDAAAATEINPHRLYGMDVWYVRSRAEEPYVASLAELQRFEKSPAVALGWKVDSRLLVLPPQYPRDFRFKPRNSFGDSDISLKIRALRSAQHQRTNSGYLVTDHDREFRLVNHYARVGRYVAMPEHWGHHLSMPRGFYDYEMSPMLFYHCRLLTRFRLGEHISWNILLTEQVVMIAIAWHREVYRKLRLWWLPRFVEESMHELRRRLPERLNQAFGNERNVDDFFALLSRRNQLLDERYDGDWKNVSELFRQGIRKHMEYNKHEPGRQGRGGDFIPYNVWTDKTIRCEEEAWHYLCQLPNAPNGQDVDDNWGNLNEDLCFLNVIDDEEPDIPFNFVPYNLETRTTFPFPTNGIWGQIGSNSRNRPSQSDRPENRLDNQDRRNPPADLVAENQVGAAAYTPTSPSYVPRDETGAVIGGRYSPSCASILSHEQVAAAARLAAQVENENAETAAVQSGSPEIVPASENAVTAVTTIASPVADGRRLSPRPDDTPIAQRALGYGPGNNSTAGAASSMLNQSGGSRSSPAPAEPNPRFGKRGASKSPESQRDLNRARTGSPSSWSNVAIPAETAPEIQPIVRPPFNCEGRRFVPRHIRRRNAAAAAAAQNPESPAVTATSAPLALPSLTAEPVEATATPTPMTAAGTPGGFNAPSQQPRSTHPAGPSADAAQQRRTDNIRSAAQDQLTMATNVTEPVNVLPFALTRFNMDPGYPYIVFVRSRTVDILPMVNGRPVRTDLGAAPANDRAHGFFVLSRPQGPNNTRRVLTNVPQVPPHFDEDNPTSTCY